MPGRFKDRLRKVALVRGVRLIDTAASVTTELLVLISAELSRMAARFRGAVVEWNPEINRAYPFRRPDAVHGRGGTDLRPRQLLNHDRGWPLAWPALPPRRLRLAGRLAGDASRDDHAAAGGAVGCRGSSGILPHATHPAERRALFQEASHE